MDSHSAYDPCHISRINWKETNIIKYGYSSTQNSVVYFSISCNPRQKLFGHHILGCLYDSLLSNFQSPLCWMKFCSPPWHKCWRSFHYNAGTAFRTHSLCNNFDLSCANEKNVCPKTGNLFQAALPYLKPLFAHTMNHIIAFTFEEKNLKAVFTWYWLIDSWNEAANWRAFTAIYSANITCWPDTHFFPVKLHIKTLGALTAFSLTEIHFLSQIKEVKGERRCTMNKPSKVIFFDNLRWLKNVLHFRFSIYMYICQWVNPI